MLFSAVNSEYLWLIALAGIGWANSVSRNPRPSRVHDPSCGFTVSDSGENTSDELEESVEEVHSDSPWHATLYIERNSSGGTRMDYQCGATIIRESLLLTAAQCVYDGTRMAIDPGVLFVLTGNAYRDYDSVQHNFHIVKKRRVKNVHVSCTHHHHGGDYASDIALLELSNPLKFSSTLRPACLDVSGYNEQILYSGEMGRVAGFGERSTNKLSEILLVKTVSYVSQDQPFTLTKSNALENADYISSDKFCGANSNGTSVSPGDRGGGLIFRRNDVWCVLGVFSMWIGVETRNGNTSCDMYSYTLYTKVSDHMTWIQNVMFDIELRGSHSPRSCHSSPFLITTVTQTRSTMTPAYVRLRTQSSSVIRSSCSAPPQPANGEWKLHRNACQGDTDCNVPEGTAIQPGSRLVCNCRPGYRAESNDTIYCQVTGKWSAIPICTEVKCSSLNSVSNTVSCFLQGEWVSCDNMEVVPHTRAIVTCLPGYKKDTAFISTRKGEVICSESGKWEPDPIRCIPVCGVAITHQKPLISKGSPASVGDFPWHASLHSQINTRTESQRVFICGATIIHPKFVVTAAHCVYNEVYKTVEDSQKFFVITGNIFRDFDSALHDPRIVRKARVKKIYAHCSYYGISGNYASDIALLELQDPFAFSSILSPACLDDSGTLEQLLEPGINGRVAGFGRTETSDTSFILQTLTVPYISNSQCKVSRNAATNEAFITTDKFCGGYNNESTCESYSFLKFIYADAEMLKVMRQLTCENSIPGSSLCEGDSGGGLVIRKGDQWHFMGIVSVGLGADTSSGERRCDVNSYTLFTKVFQYVSWIQDIMYFVGRKRSVPPCREQSVSCVTPPQPPNGEWRLHRGSCKDDTNCKISEGTLLPDSSQLDYSCDPGFMTEDPTSVYCRYDGTWTPIPTCKPLPAIICSTANASLVAAICTWQNVCRSDFRNRIGRDPSDGACQYSGPESICCVPRTPQEPIEIPDQSGNRRLVGDLARNKCKHYSRYVYASKCPPVDADDRQPPTALVNLGKMRAARTEFPHMAAIGYDSETNGVAWKCGGTLISEEFVLTAAHCTHHPQWGNATWVRVGDLNLARSDDGAAPLNRRIIERIRSPEYRPEFIYHDIALLRLESRVFFNRWIRPACLHTEPSLEAQEATASGWGVLSQGNGTFLGDLMKVSVPIVDSQSCNASLANRFPRRLPEGINDDLLICAGTKGKETCKTDSGGPLVILSKTNYCMYDLVGITIGGPGRCGSGIPGLFTRVFNYILWIEQIVWGQG